MSRCDPKLTRFVCPECHAEGGVPPQAWREFWAEHPASLTEEKTWLKTARAWFEAKGYGKMSGAMVECPCCECAAEAKLWVPKGN